MTKKSKAEAPEVLTDFNDLYCKLGLDEVRTQIEAALQQAPPESPAPSESGVAPLARPDIAEAVRRFAWTVPDGRVWDFDDQKILKPAQLKAWLGDVLYQTWFTHDGRQIVPHAKVARLAFAADRQGGGELGEALRRYQLIYPTQDAWDAVRRDRVPLAALKPALHRWYTPWLEHPERGTIDVEMLVFDPCHEFDEAKGYINYYKGITHKHRDDPHGCHHIQRLLFHLCNEDRTIYEWLTCWVAYPLQHEGAKLQSAVLMHSEVQGSGKSFFWESIIKTIYGEYGATLGQHQLESQYTDWKKEKLYCLFEEVLSRDQKYVHTGTLKHMITGATHRIEKKFVSGWEEANHINAVFLSNELQPFPIEPSDRRWMVVWPRKQLPDELKKNVAQEIKLGGIEAYLGFLLKWPMKWTTPDGTVVDFDVREYPPVTDAKARLIEFSLPNWDIFFRDWQAGRLPWPYQTVLVRDLYNAYRKWCNASNERCMAMSRFSNVLSVRLNRRSDVDYVLGVRRLKGTFFIINGPEDDVPWMRWLGEVVERWQRLLEGDDV